MVHQVVVDGSTIAAVVNMNFLKKESDDKGYISMAIFIDLSDKGQITKWRSYVDVPGDA